MTLNNLLEIKLNGESIKEFNPDEAIIHWLNTGSKMRHINGHKSKNKEKEVWVSTSFVVFIVYIVNKLSYIINLYFIYFTHFE